MPQVDIFSCSAKKKKFCQITNFNGRRVLKIVPLPNWIQKRNIQMTSRIHMSDCAKETEAVAWQVKQQE